LPGTVVRERAAQCRLQANVIQRGGQNPFQLATVEHTIDGVALHA
jgi:hypothetical protein